MSANRPGGRPAPSKVPPTSRRSARQQRLANREANRSLARASTHGSGGGPSPLILYSVVAGVIGIVVIGVLLFLSSQKSAPPVLADPIAPQPSVATPSGIPTSGRTMGNADAKVTIDMWEDFQCTGCYAFTNGVEPQLVTNYVATGKAKVNYHDFIIIDANGDTESFDSANAAMCANDQGKFWPYHDWLFANQYAERSGAFTKDRLKAIAHAMGGLDNAKFDSCVDGGSHDSDVTAEQKTVPSNANQTPWVVINGTAVTSPDYATIAAALDTALGVSPSPSVGASPSASASPSPSPSPTPSVAPSASPSVNPS
ncbi:MAG: DsbA family protein [Candidatus Limnocylindrales bacterium]